MKRRLIDHDHALFPAQVRGPRRQRRDPLARTGKADGVGLDVLGRAVLVDVGEQLILDLAGCVVERARPHRRGLDVLDRHVLRRADVEHARSALGARREHVVRGLRPGQAHAARFLRDLERGRVRHPRALIRQQRRRRGGRVCGPGLERVERIGARASIGRYFCHTWASIGRYFCHTCAARGRFHLSVRQFRWL